MTKTLKPYHFINDYVTGQKIPMIGSEENRQTVERYLVERKKYQKTDIQVNAPIEIDIDGKPYRSVADLVVSVDDKRFMTVKCVAGSLDSWTREIVSASRLIDAFQLPLSVVSDGQAALVLDTITGKTIGKGLASIPSIQDARNILKDMKLCVIPKDRIKREQLIFRSYDTMKVNIHHY